jgi:hypothetical protein
MRLGSGAGGRHDREWQRMPKTKQRRSLEARLNNQKNGGALNQIVGNNSRDIGVLDR